MKIVDFNDNGHPLLRQWTRKRRNRCEELEWFEASDVNDQTSLRVSRFYDMRRTEVDQ